MNFVYRSISFLCLLFIPIMFGWWLFFPLLILYIYLAIVPVEVFFVAIFLDRIYYLGEGIWAHLFLITAFLCLSASFFLKDKLIWNKLI